MRQEICQNQTLFGSKGVFDNEIWIRGQIWGFLVISRALMRVAVDPEFWIWIQGVVDRYFLDPRADLRRRSRIARSMCDCVMVHGISLRDRDHDLIDSDRVGPPQGVSVANQLRIAADSLTTLAA